MDDDKLKIIILFKNFFNDIYQSLLNCNRNHLELKQIMIYECNLYLKDLYLANDYKDIELKKKIKEELIIRIKHLGSLVTMLYQNKLISHKKYLKLGNDLEILLRLLNGWKNK